MDEVRATETAVRPSCPPANSYRACDLTNLTFASTAELAPIDGLIGQSRALEAVRFGTKVDKAGFNLFVIGGTGVGMREAVKAMLAEEAAAPAESFRLGLCQQFRRSGPADRDRASRPAARRASRRRCTS